jgi:hypothetical protein
MAGQTRFVSSNDKLEQAMVQVRSSQQEAELFSRNPAQYLASKGITTEKLRLQSATYPGPPLDVAAISVCASVGCIVCATVGGDV